MQESHKTKLVLFDLDGTLVDTALDFIHSLNNILRANHRDELDGEIIRSNVSEGSAKLIEIGFKIPSNHPDLEKYRKELLIEYKKNLTNKSKPFLGIEKLIKHLDFYDIPYGVVTNKPLKYAKPLIENFSIFDTSKILICPDHVKNIKPDPEGILLACSSLDINPNESVYIGDHPGDIEAGMNAGTKTIGCLYGYSLPQKYNRNKTMFVDQASEIISLLE
jgi:phosphoglycolate phosphatase